MASLSMPQGANMPAGKASFECQIGEQHSDRSRNFMTCKTMGSVFVLGMVVGMAGFFVVDYYGSANSNITSLFVSAPVVPRLGASGEQVNNISPTSALSHKTGQIRATAPGMMSSISRRKALQAAASLAGAGIGAPVLAAQTAVDAEAPLTPSQMLTVGEYLTDLKDARRDLEKIRQMVAEGQDEGYKSARVALRIKPVVLIRPSCKKTLLELPEDSATWKAKTATFDSIRKGLFEIDAGCKPDVEQRPNLLALIDTLQGDLDDFASGLNNTAK